jgi:hypothetical protein
VTQTMYNETAVKLERLGMIEEEATFSVSVDGHALGNVTFATFYEPVVKGLDRYFALWAGPTLCVIDRLQRTLRCVERGDETHGVHQFNTAWIVEGELRIDLFEPATLDVAASYVHDEVITDSWLNGELIYIRDFQNRTLCLKPSEKLAPVVSD